jgi:hypothetical protein
LPIFITITADEYKFIFAVDNGKDRDTRKALFDFIWACSEVKEGGVVGNS